MIFGMNDGPLDPSPCGRAVVMVPPFCLIIYVARNSDDFFVMCNLNDLQQDVIW